MIKDIKNWFTKTPQGTTVVNVQVELLSEAINHSIVEEIRSDVVRQVSNKFLQNNNDTLTKLILDNPNFADRVYNAIVLKKADHL